MRSVSIALLIIAISVNALSAAADTETHLWSDTDIQISPLVTLQNHGYLRFRLNDFYRLDLGAGGASGFLHPLESSAVNAPLGRSGENIVTANIRFRYEPALLIGEYLTIKAQIDFLDNVTMGSTPGGDATVPLSFFARTQVSPDAGLVSFYDAVRVKALWADLRVFERVHIAGGRMPEKFGLGILRSDGASKDSDFGDYVDAIWAKIKLGEVYFRVGMEFPGEGATSESPTRWFGPIHDAEQFDDIIRWVFVFDSSPVEKEDFEVQKKKLEDGEVVLDWGMYHAITQQGIASDRIGGTVPPYCGQVDQVYGLPYDCYAMTPRGAFFWTPALWGRLLYNPTPYLKVRLEAEWTMVYGNIDYMQSFLDVTTNRTGKDFLEFGAALEADVSYYDNDFGFRWGLASGDETSNKFGILDGQTLVALNEAGWNLPTTDPAIRTRSKVRNFAFNRDYRVDSILFREVIGTVTNAFYFKPSYHRWVFQKERHKLGLGASMLAAFAMEPAGTPGDDRRLGIEAGFTMDYHFTDDFLVLADGAVLFPLEGLRLLKATEDPRIAAAFRTMFVVSF